MNKKVTITLYLPEDVEVNDVNVGRALGEALLTNNLQYSSEDNEMQLENLKFENQRLREIISFLNNRNGEDE